MRYMEHRRRYMSLIYNLRIGTAWAVAGLAYPNLFTLPVENERECVHEKLIGNSVFFTWYHFFRYLPRMISQRRDIKLKTVFPFNSKQDRRILSILYGGIPFRNMFLFSFISVPFTGYAYLYSLELDVTRLLCNHLFHEKRMKGKNL